MTASRVTRLRISTLRGRSGRRTCALVDGATRDNGDDGADQPEQTLNSPLTVFFRFHRPAPVEDSDLATLPVDAGDSVVATRRSQQSRLPCPKPGGRVCRAARGGAYGCPGGRPACRGAGSPAKATAWRRRWRPSPSAGERPSGFRTSPACCRTSYPLDLAGVERQLNELLDDVKTLSDRVLRDADSARCAARGDGRGVHRQRPLALIRLRIPAAARLVFNQNRSSWSWVFGSTTSERR